MSASSSRSGSHGPGGGGGPASRGGTSAERPRRCSPGGASAARSTGECFAQAPSDAGERAAGDVLTSGHASSAESDSLAPRQLLDDMLPLPDAGLVARRALRGTATVRSLLHEPGVSPVAAACRPAVCRMSHARLSLATSGGDSGVASLSPSRASRPRSSYRSSGDSSSSDSRLSCSA